MNECFLRQAPRARVLFNFRMAPGSAFPHAGWFALHCQRVSADLEMGDLSICAHNSGHGCCAASVRWAPARCLETELLSVCLVIQLAMTDSLAKGVVRVSVLCTGKN